MSQFCYKFTNKPPLVQYQRYISTGQHLIQRTPKKDKKKEKAIYKKDLTADETEQINLTVIPLDLIAFLLNQMVLIFHL